MKIKKSAFNIFHVILFCFFSLQSFAANKYWVGTGGSTAWNNNGNWSMTSGTAGSTPPPSTGDIAIFNGAGGFSGNCTVNAANISLGGISITAGYMGTFNLNGFTMTVGTSNASFAGGTFTGASGAITINGDFSLSGGTFTSTTGTMSFNKSNGSVSFTGGTFTASTGKVLFTETGQFITNGSTYTFYDLEFSAASSTKVTTITSTTINVTNVLTISGAGSVGLVGGTINAKGNITVTNSGTGGGGGATININGTGAQTLTGTGTILQGALCTVRLDKSTGTLTLKKIITCARDWTYIQGSMDPTTSGADTSTVAFTATSGACVISGSTNDSYLFYRVFFQPSTTATYTIPTGFFVYADITIAGSSAATFNGGTIVPGKNVIITNSATGGGGSATIGFSQAGTTQSIIGTSTIHQGTLCKVVFNKSSGTVYLKKIVTSANDWTYTTGTVTAINSGADSSTVVFAASNTISGSTSGSYTLYNVTFEPTSAGTFVIPTTFTVSNNLRFSGSQNITLNTGTVFPLKHFIITNTGTGGGGSATISYTGTGNQTIIGTSTSNQGRLCIVSFNKSSGNVTLKKVITSANNWSYAGSQVVTATNSGADSCTIVFTRAATGTTTITGSTSGNYTLYNITFDSPTSVTSTYTIPTTFTVLNNLRLTGAGSVVLNTGTIAAKKHILITNSGASGGGSATVSIDGTVDQTLLGSGTAGNGALPKVVINKGSNILTLSSVITCANDWTYTAGIGSSTGSTVAFTGSFNIDGENGTPTVMGFSNVSIIGSSSARALTGKLDVNGTLTIAATCSLSQAGYDVFVAGDWSNSGTYTHGNGEVTFDGTGSQALTKSGGETFYKLKINKTASTVLTLNDPVTVSNTFTLTEGIVNTTTDLLTLASTVTATTVGGSPDNTCYVSGPMKKIGNTAFTFPLGKSAYYHPLGITAPSSGTDAFTAEYFSSSSGSYPPATKISSLDYVSNCEYWMLNRTTGSSNVTVTLSWNTNSCNIDPDYLVVAGWDNTQWTELGSGTLVNNGATGTISTLAAVSSFPVSTNNLPMTLATKENYAILNKKLDGGYYITKLNRLYFKYFEEYKKESGDKLTYNIYDGDDNVKITSTPAIDVKYGENKYVLDLTTVAGGGALSNGFYILEVINEKNEKQYLRFKK